MKPTRIYMYYVGICGGLGAIGVSLAIHYTNKHVQYNTIQKIIHVLFGYTIGVIGAHIWPIILLGRFIN